MFDTLLSIHSISDIVNNITTPEVAVSVGIGTAFIILMIWFIFSNMELKIIHFVVMAIVGVLIGCTLQSYTALYDWLIIGVSGMNIGASVFFFGLCCFIAVMIWNLLNTKGQTAVR